MTILFDIETVVDRALLVDVTRMEHDDYLDDLESRGRQRFVPANFHRPVAIAAAIIKPDYSLTAVSAREETDPAALAARFWQRALKLPMHGLVTFGGRTFDLPVLEREAFRAGINISLWMKLGVKSWVDPRNRYNTAGHIDLCDVLGNFGACWMHGGLNLCAKLAGAPGKLDTSGSDVERLHAEGDFEAIRGYCICDVLDTYIVFLRTLVLLGKIDSAREKELRAAMMPIVEDSAKKYPAVQLYREAM